MKIKQVAVFLFFILLLVACGSNKEPEQAKSCLDSIPKTIKGLQVNGARSEQNVIQNLWPIVCIAREKYRERLKENPKLKGTIELNISVEFNGEIGSHGIIRSTLKDPVLEKQVLRLIQMKDFDPYGSQNSESEILFPIHLKP